MPPQDDRYTADDVVHAIRARIVDVQVADWLRAKRAADPSWRSALLVVAQFWNDEADDEVHLEVVYSREPRVEWPDVDDGERDRRPAGAWPKDALIPAFEVFCADRPNYPDNPYEGITDWFPIAHANLLDTSDTIVSERVWGIQRAWLDMPHEHAPPPPQLDARLLALLGDPEASSVVADALQDIGDPRGDLIAGVSVHDERLARSWLGTLDRHVPRAGVRFVDGIPREIELWFDSTVDTAIDPDDPLPWACAPHIRFSPGSARPIMRGMASARSLGAVGVRELEALATLDVQLACTELAIEVDAQDAGACMRAFDALRAPHLEALRVCGPFSAIEPHAWATRTRRVELASVFEDADEHARAVTTCARAGVPIRLAMIDPDTRRVGGWCIDFANRTITRRGFSRIATRERYVALVAAL